MYIELTTIEGKTVRVYPKDVKRFVEVEHFTLVITKGMNYKVRETPEDIESRLIYAIRNEPVELSKHNIKRS